MEEWLNKIICGDCLEVMKDFDDESIDTIVTDPPYGLEFMGKGWDSYSDNEALEGWTERWATEALRIVKPGAIMLCFGGTRTFHRIACGIEDAGWEIRDTLMWVYGSGFPKSHNIGKAIAKKKGENVKQGTAFKTAGEYGGRNLKDPTPIKDREQYRHKPQTKEAKRWHDYGTALKPAYEPILLCMKPYENTYAENALKHDVAGLNIDGGRIDYEDKQDKSQATPQGKCTSNVAKGARPDVENEGREDFKRPEQKGRFPANLIHDGSEEATKDMGDKSRYFYCAKASKKERNMGLEDFDKKKCGRNQSSLDGGEIKTGSGNERTNYKKNNHPTVKPLALMEYLVELTKMPNEDQIYLDPFIGSGTTAMAVKKKNRNYIGIEQKEEYCKIARARIRAVQKTLF